MRRYQLVCTDCGASSKVYDHLSPLSRLIHRCGDVCAECGWSSAVLHRGLCQPCYLTDARFDHETKIRKADDLLDDYDLLRREGYTVRQAADRLGIKFDALDKALCRAKRRGDPRAVRRAA